MSLFSLEFLKTLEGEAEKLLGKGGLVSHIEQCIASGMADFNDIVSKTASVLGIPLDANQQGGVAFYKIEEIAASPDLLAKIAPLFLDVLSGTPTSATSLILMKTLLRKS